MEQVRDGLLARGVNPWAYPFDNDNLDGWSPQLDRAINQDTDGCAVLVGPHGLGAVQRDELFEALRRRLGARQERTYTLVPVLLPGAQRSKQGGLEEILRGHHWVEFPETINDSARLDELAARLRGETPGRTRRTLQPAECPYRGLEYFDVEHADLFFGRDLLVDEILSAIRGTRDERGRQRFIAIVGVSGSGKSSLARAGVLASLARSANDGGNGRARESPCTIVRVSPGEEPIHSLARALAEAGDGVLVPAPFDDFVAQVRRNPRYLDDKASEWARGKPKAWRLAILIDGFETVLKDTTGGNEQQRADAKTLVSALIRAGTAEGGRVIVLLTLRDDFLGLSVNFEGLPEASSRCQFVVGALSALELREAIVQPAHLAQREVDRGLVEALVADVGEDAGALPLAQLVLRDLWLRHDGLPDSARAEYLRHRLAGCLDDHAERVWAKVALGSEGQPGVAERRAELARTMLLRLVDARD